MMRAAKFGYQGYPHFAVSFEFMDLEWVDGVSEIAGNQNVLPCDKINCNAHILYNAVPAN